MEASCGGLPLTKESVSMAARWCMTTESQKGMAIPTRRGMTTESQKGMTTESASMPARRGMTNGYDEGV